MLHECIQDSGFKALSNEVHVCFWKTTAHISVQPCHILAQKVLLQAYTSVGQLVVRLVEEIMHREDIESSSDEPWQIYLTGHSMGGALATLCAYELAVRSCAQSSFLLHPTSSFMAYSCAFNHLTLHFSLFTFKHRFYSVTV